MGTTFIFDENVDRAVNGGNDICTVEVLDDHGTPEIRIGPEGEAYKGYCASFLDWNQFDRFVDAVNDLHFRLKGVKTGKQPC